MLSDAQLTRMNPWWTSPAWEALDPHLRDLAERPVRLPSPLVEEIDLDAAGLHTVRGPRQVGKSTDLKLLARRALTSGRDARQVVYIAMDLLLGQPITELDATVDRAKQLARAGPGTLVLLDEVTVVTGWDVAIKALWDSGPLRGDVVICTGSSAYDLHRGAPERWPGRRGRGGDHLVLPQSFGSFARALHPAVPPSPRLTVAELMTPPGRETLLDVQVHGPTLMDAFGRYLRFGGLPAAVAEAAGGAVQPSRETMRILADSVVREVHRKGAGEPATHALLDRVSRSLGSTVSWTAIAQDLGVPLGSSRTARSGPTPLAVRDYVEFLAVGYFLLLVYFWRSGAMGADLSRDKKLYFADPLLHSVAAEHAGGAGADDAALVENVLALALYRRYEPKASQIPGFLEPSRLHVWKSTRGTEIDFAAGTRQAPDLVEVKYRSSVDRRVLTGMNRAFPGRPAVVATRSELEWLDGGALVPAHLLAWALA